MARNFDGACHFRCVVRSRTREFECFVTAVDYVDAVDTIATAMGKGDEIKSIEQTLDGNYFVSDRVARLPEGEGGSDL